jgi:1A family penicillin-binding protein
MTSERLPRSAGRPSRWEDGPAAEAGAPPGAGARRGLSPAVWLGLGGAVFAALALTAWLAWALPLGRALEPLPTPTLVLVTADGKPFARRGSYKEAPVDAAKLPAYVPLAFVAVEDRRFFQHHGVDPGAVARALVRNLMAGRIQEGGSTLTQQLAKNAFLTGDRTLRRKAQEALIALYLEARLSKAEILSRYLSAVYFGDGVFGLRAAARHYFDKSPEQLSVGEAAMLAGMVKAPSRLAPTEDLAAARRRARLVLADMAGMGLVTPAQARTAASQVKVRRGRATLGIGSWFADWVSPQAKQAFQWGYGEVRVGTTIDSRLQAAAERIVERTLAAEGARRNAHQAALVAMRTDGAVVAMVGGRDYRKSVFNRAVDAERPPGSAFKLFVYLAALRQGFSPDSQVEDAPVRVGDWTPSNYGEDYAGGPISLRRAFARSSNVAAVRVAQAVGLPAVKKAARDLGVAEDLPDDATLALGTANVNLLELTAAYAAVDAGAAPVAPRGLQDVPVAAPGLQIGERERRGMLELLHAVVASGTGTAANVGQPAYGKTGTSQDYRDAWFVGFVGDLAVGVWVGNDDDSPMKGVTGGSLPARIWRDFMAEAIPRLGLKGEPPPGEPVPSLQAPAPDGPLQPADPDAGLPAGLDDSLPSLVLPPADAAREAPGPAPRRGPPPDLGPPPARYGPYGPPPGSRPWRDGWRGRDAGPPPRARRWRDFGPREDYLPREERYGPPPQEAPYDDPGPPPGDDE